MKKKTLKKKLRESRQRHGVHVANIAVAFASFVVAVENEARSVLTKGPSVTRPRDALARILALAEEAQK